MIGQLSASWGWVWVFGFVWVWQEEMKITWNEQEIKKIKMEKDDVKLNRLNINRKRWSHCQQKTGFGWARWVDNKEDGKLVWWRGRRSLWAIVKCMLYSAKYLKDKSHYPKNIEWSWGWNKKTLIEIEVHSFQVERFSEILIQISLRLLLVVW